MVDHRDLVAARGAVSGLAAAAGPGEFGAQRGTTGVIVVLDVEGLLRGDQILEVAHHRCPERTRPVLGRLDQREAGQDAHYRDDDEHLNQREAATIHARPQRKGCAS